MSDATATLDTQGLMCPEPVMMLHNAVRDMAAGELLQVLATDPSTQRDIPRFCQFLGHELLCRPPLPQRPQRSTRRRSDV